MALCVFLITLTLSITSSNGSDVPFTCNVRTGSNVTHIGEISTVSCTESEIMVSCGINGVQSIGGSWIENNICKAFSNRNYSVEAKARCCIFPQNAFISSSIISSAEGESVSSSCTADEVLTGCHVYYTSGDYNKIKGSFVGPFTTLPQTIEWIPTDNQCNAASYSGGTVKADATCLSVKNERYSLQCTTKAAFSNRYGFGFCENGYTMMSCGTFTVTQSLASYYIEDNDGSDSCYIQQDDNQEMYANSICCKLTMLDFSDSNCIDRYFNDKYLNFSAEPINFSAPNGHIIPQFVNCDLESVAFGKGFECEISVTHRPVDDEYGKKQSLNIINTFNFVNFTNSNSFCCDPTITFDYINNDFDNNGEFINIYENNAMHGDILIARCGDDEINESIDCNDTTCVKDAPLMNTSMYSSYINITVDVSSLVDNYCDEYQIKSTLTLNCKRCMKPMDYRNVVHEIEDIFYLNCNRHQSCFNTTIVGTQADIIVIECIHDETCVSLTIDAKYIINNNDIYLSTNNTFDFDCVGNRSCLNTSIYQENIHGNRIKCFGDNACFDTIIDSKYLINDNNIDMRNSFDLECCGNESCLNVRIHQENIHGNSIKCFGHNTCFDLRIDAQYVLNHNITNISTDNTFYLECNGNNVIGIRNFCYTFLLYWRIICTICYILVDV